jgi:hypothetical protein
LELKSSVKIRWSDVIAQRIVAPGRYVQPAKFPDAPDDTWSVVLEFNEPTHGTASFLAAAAPHHLLKRGVTFQMFEGPTLTATVSVL